MVTKHFLKQVLGLRNIIETGDNWMCSCPFAKTQSVHKDGTDSHPSFGISKNTGVYNCFSCKEKGSLTSLVSKLLDVSQEEATSVIDGEIPKDSPSSFLGRVDELLNPLKKELYTQFIVLPEEYNLNLSEEAARFLYDKRHVFDEAIKYFEIGFCKDGYYANRLIIPVYVKKVLKGFIARDITDEGKRYLYPSGFPKKEVLFNIDGVEGDTVFLVEGCFDVIQLWQNGVKNSVAVLCSDLSQEQITLLLERKIRKVVLLFDNDLAGQGAQREAFEKLKSFFEVKTTRYPFGIKDPGDLWEKDKVDFILQSIQFLPFSKKIKEKNLMQTLYKKTSIIYG